MGRSVKTPKTTKLKRDLFRYPDDLKIELPALVLAIPVPDWAMKEDAAYQSYRFKPSRQWVKLAHQTAGIACHQHYMEATVLTPKSTTILRSMIELSRRWDGTNAGAFGVTLNELNDYRADLQRHFGADCNTCHRDFEEALLPVDTEHIAKLTAEPLPANLDDLIEWRDGWERAMGCIGRFQCYILGFNSD